MHSEPRDKEDSYIPDNNIDYERGSKSNNINKTEMEINFDDPFASSRTFGSHEYSIRDYTQLLSLDNNWRARYIPQQPKRPIII